MSDAQIKSLDDKSLISIDLANSSAKDQLACRFLNIIFPNTTAIPSEVVTYSSKISINWSVRAWLKSSCVFSPSTTEMTSVGMKVVNFLGNKFAIRSGGHTPDPEMASIDDGILFSLENLNMVQMDESLGIASIGPGNRWGDVYDKLSPKGYVVVGGRVPPVGAGGLITGGGLSYFSGTHGFACDNVLNYEVVLGNGTIVNANAQTNSDLWWALKGGSNNFGLVTRFDLNAIPKKDGIIWGGNIYFSPLQSEAVIKALTDFQKVGQVDDPKAALIGNWIRAPATSLTELTDILRVTVFHQDPTDGIPESLQPFFDLNPFLSTAMNRTLLSLAEDTYGPANIVPPARQVFRTLAVGANEELLNYAYAKFNTSYSILFPSLASVAVLTHQPVSEAMASYGARPMAVPTKAQTWLIVNIQWSLEISDKKILKIVQSFLDDVKAKSVEMGLDEDYLYLNDASRDQKVLEGYGTANVAEMKTVSAKYDPGQVFQKQVPGGFKLINV
ncbi:hypothetical protein DFP73DRAFT_488064 [Morchella snyderi]|nr:hypothetical protein DFP73DRAFT_488064 [Morchella snyderi]